MKDARKKGIDTYYKYIEELSLRGLEEKIVQLDGTKFFSD
jgi:hypothetical protein